MLEKMDYTDWDIKLSEWRGYVLRALEDSNKELKDIKESIELCESKIDKVNNRLTGVQIKVGALGATVAIIVSITLNVIL